MSYPYTQPSLTRHTPTQSSYNQYSRSDSQPSESVARIQAAAQTQLTVSEATLSIGKKKGAFHPNVTVFLFKKDQPLTETESVEKLIVPLRDYDPANPFNIPEDVAYHSQQSAIYKAILSHLEKQPEKYSEKIIFYSKKLLIHIDPRHSLCNFDAESAQLSRKK